jgi:hypothetical protein
LHKCNRIPAYPTGAGDGNTNNAGNQNAIYKLPLTPTQNTGTLSPTTAGNIGIFVNGVFAFIAMGSHGIRGTNAICGGPPGNPTCPGGLGATFAWNRDAIPAEKLGFDCKHPAGTNLHHHQNLARLNMI